MYPQPQSLATHGRAMYFRNGETVGFGNLDCLAAVYSLTRSARHQAAAQRNPRQINPLVRLLRAHKGEFLHVNAAAARKLCPAVAGSHISFLRLAFSAQFCNGEMWHVRPLLRRSQHLRVEPVVQFAHAITRVRHPNKNGRSDRDEAFHFTQSNFEGIGMAANLLEKLQRGKLIPLQTTRRQYGEVGREVGMIGMQFLAQPLDKFSGGISDVGHQSVARSLHPDGIINLCAIGASPLRKQSAIIEKTHHQSRGVAQPGSAPALGAGGRRFKSYRPDQHLLHFHRPREARTLETPNLGPTWIQKEPPPALQPPSADLRSANANKPAA